jgi:hypothetical protein
MAVKASHDLTSAQGTRRDNGSPSLGARHGLFCRVCRRENRAALRSWLTVRRASDNAQAVLGIGHPHIAEHADGGDLRLVQHGGRRPVLGREHFDRPEAWTRHRSIHSGQR